MSHDVCEGRALTDCTEADRCVPMLATSKNNNEANASERSQRWLTRNQN